jgi:hypothetical protein
MKRVLFFVFIAILPYAGFSSPTHKPGWFNQIPGWFGTSSSYPRSVTEISFGGSKLDYAGNLQFEKWVAGLTNQSKAKWSVSNGWNFVIVNGLKCNNKYEGKKNANCFFSFSYKGPYANRNATVHGRYFLQCYLVIGNTPEDSDNQYIKTPCPSGLR